MNILEKIKVQYIYDDGSTPIGVFLDMKTFENLVEQIEDLYLGMSAMKVLECETEFVSHEEVEEIIGLHERKK